MTETGSFDASTLEPLLDGPRQVAALLEKDATRQELLEIAASRDMEAPPGHIALVQVLSFAHDTKLYTEMSRDGDVEGEVTMRGIFIAKYWDDSEGRRVFESLAGPGTFPSLTQTQT